MSPERSENTLGDAPAGLQPSHTSGSKVEPTGQAAWHLEMPAGPRGKYRLAQLDNYGSLPRRLFPHRPPFRLSLQARASAEVIPGTWGFGLWNNPFGMAILRGVELLRLPALPNAAWFFFASPPNYLSLRDDLPAQGWLAATFRSPRWRPLVLALGAPALPLLAWATAARQLRRLGRRIVRQDAARLSLDPRDWHRYEMEWQPAKVRFWVDGELALETSAAPHGPLGLVIWVDNQYARLGPDGHVRFGTLANPEPAWIEIRGLEVIRD